MVVDRYSYTWSRESTVGINYDKDYNPIPSSAPGWIYFKCDQQPKSNSIITGADGTQYNISYILYVPHTEGLHRGDILRDPDGKHYTLINFTNDRVGGRIWV